MFKDACGKIRECTYALIARSVGKTVSCATAFMIAPGVLVTVAHALYKNEGDSSSLQENIHVIRDPEIPLGRTMEKAGVIAIDEEYDMGLLRIESPRANEFISFTTSSVRVATKIGTVGYPFMDPNAILDHKAVPLLRFQGGHISAIYGAPHPSSGRHFSYFETDMPMYKGSSGSPGFLIGGDVFGMHIAEWHDRGHEEEPGQRAFSVWAPASAIIALAQKNKVVFSK